MAPSSSLEEGMTDFGFQLQLEIDTAQKERFKKISLVTEAQTSRQKRFFLFEYKYSVAAHLGKM